MRYYQHEFILILSALDGGCTLVDERTLPGPECPCRKCPSARQSRSRSRTVEEKLSLCDEKLCNGAEEAARSSGRIAQRHTGRTYTRSGALPDDAAAVGQASTKSRRGHVIHARQAIMPRMPGGRREIEPGGRASPAAHDACGRSRRCPAAAARRSTAAAGAMAADNADERRLIICSARRIER